MTQKYTNARSTEYAMRSDFCQLYLEQMNRLYLLSLLLTVDPQKAEQCFLAGFEDCMSNNFVFKERAYQWARRSIILDAIRLLCPRPSDENELNEAWPLSNGTVPPNFAGVLRLDPFERFVFIMSILEGYSVKECSLLLGCFRRDAIEAQTAAMRRLASLAIATEPQPERDVINFARINYANRLRP